jgi:peptidyl-prolyl cis-trans isomerase B (cyclophilin B)
VPKSTKRERQRVNREIRREAMRKAEQRRRTMRTVRNAAIALVVVAVVFGAIKIIQGDNGSSAGAVTCENVPKSEGTKLTFSAPPPMTVDTTMNYTADMDTSCGKITFALDVAKYPVAVNNFVFLAQQKFYDGLDVSRVAKAPPIFQAGSPTNDGVGGPGYSVAAEVPTGTPPYPLGALAMAKSGAEPAGTAGSQFFVITGKNSGLDPDYAYVGTVTKGLDVAKKIASFLPAGTTADGPPTTRVRINGVTISVSKGTTTSAPTTTLAP